MKVLALRGSTLDFNPSFDRSIIESAYAEDPQAAAAEWGGEFRRDLQGFVSREVVRACVINGRYELLPTNAFRYVAFADPSGGSNDSFTLAISHNENGLSVLDCVREIIPPFSPTSVVQELAEVLKSYRLSQVSGDKYAGIWPTDLFAKHAIKYIPSTQTKSEIYLECLPLLNSRKVQLLDNRKLIVQLVSLERRTRSGGKDTVDHNPGGHDDIINSATGSLLLAQKQRSGFRGINLDGSSDFTGTNAEFMEREKAIAKKRLIQALPESEVEKAVKKYMDQLEKQLLG